MLGRVFVASILVGWFGWFVALVLVRLFVDGSVGLRDRGRGGELVARILALSGVRMATGGEQSQWRGEGGEEEDGSSGGCCGCIAVVCC